MNKDKTTINEVMTKQKRTNLPGQPPQLVVKDKKGNDKTILADRYTRLLGSNIGNNLS